MILINTAIHHECVRVNQTKLLFLECYSEQFNLGKNLKSHQIAIGSRPSLVRRLTRINLSVLFLSMVSSFILIALVLWLTARERQGEGAELSALQTASNVAAMLLFHDKTESVRELALLASRRDLIATSLYNINGELFASYKAPVPLLNTQKTMLTRDYQHLVIRLQVPVYEKNELVGVLVVHEKLNKLRNWFIQGLLIMSAIMALLFLFSARILIKIQQKALKPLVQLTALAEQVASERNFSLRAQVQDMDEIGRLSQRFNELLKRIETWQSEMSHELEHAHQASEQLTQLALYDNLTGLPNRLYFRQLLAQMVAYSRQHHQLMALLFIDLDNFKFVNDNYGHEAGDALLILVGKRLNEVLRNEDKLCRLGGDEFALLLPGQQSVQATEHLAERLLNQIRQPLVINDVVMPVGMSIGIAFCPLNSHEPNELLNCADEAMYTAKRAGKNDYYVWKKQ